MTVAPCPLTVHCCGEPDITFFLTPLRYLKTAITSSLNPSPRWSRPASSPWGPYWPCPSLPQPCPWAQRPHFISARGCWSPPQQCHKGLQPCLLNKPRMHTAALSPTLSLDLALLAPVDPSGWSLALVHLLAVLELSMDPTTNTQLCLTLSDTVVPISEGPQLVLVSPPLPAWPLLRVAQLLLLPRPLSFRQNPQYIHSYVWT